MSTITVTVSGPDVGTTTITETFDTTNGTRFFNWLMAAYGKDASGNARTPAQAVQAFWAAVRANTFTNIQQHEAQIAAANAANGVTALLSTTAVT